MANRRRTCTLAVLLTLLVLTGAACGDSNSDAPTSTGLPLSVEGLIVAEPEGDVSVVGFLVIDSAGPRLCSALAESFPPQCGGPSVEIISGLDDHPVQYEEAQGVRWTDPAVVVEGRYVDGTFTLQGNG
jgi:hypothetical protein